MKLFDRVFDWLEARPLYQIVVGVVLAFVILAMLAGCGPVNCRTDPSVMRAKAIEILMEKPGGGVEPHEYQWSQFIREQYPQCWSEVER